jgi:hypothetical protein
MDESTERERPEPLATFDRLEKRLDEERHYRTLSDAAAARDRASHKRLRVIVAALAVVLVAAVVVGGIAASRFGDVIDSVHEQTSAIRATQKVSSARGRRLEAGQVILLCAANQAVQRALGQPSDNLGECLVRNAVTIGDLIDTGSTDPTPPAP